MNIDEMKDYSEQEIKAALLQDMRKIFGEAYGDPKQISALKNRIILSIVIGVALVAFTLSTAIAQYNESYHVGFIIFAGVVGAVAVLVNLFILIKKTAFELRMITPTKIKTLNKNRKKRKTVDYSREKTIKDSGRRALNGVIIHAALFILGLTSIFVSFTWAELDAVVLFVVSLASGSLLTSNSVGKFAESLNILRNVRKYNRGEHELSPKFSEKIDENSDLVS